MDAAQLIHPNLPIIVAGTSILLLSLATYFGSPWLAGILGKARIERELGLLRKKGATVLHHIQLPTKTGDLVHIDHLIITNAQVIAISTLGYFGEIMGSIRSSVWTQETAQGSNRIPSPLKEHDLILQTIHGALGTRLKVRAISALTAGKVRSDSKDIVAAATCARAMHAAVDGVTTGAKQEWASNIIRNVSLSGRESEIEKEKAFIARQGNESHFKSARYLLVISATLMLLAMALAGLRLAATHGLI